MRSRYLIPILISMFLATTANAQDRFWDLGITLLPGESYHFHKENVEFFGYWEWLWIEWQTEGTVDVHIEVNGMLHLEPGEVVQKHVQSSVPFDDVETFVNNSGQTQVLNVDVTVGDAGAVNTNQQVGDTLQSQINASITAASAIPEDPTLPYEMWKDVTNVDPVTNWWGYSEESWIFNLPVTITESLHYHAHFEALIVSGKWIWITNVGTAPVTFDFHAHWVRVPALSTIASVALVGVMTLVGGYLALRRSRQTLELG